MSVQHGLPLACTGIGAVPVRERNRVATTAPGTREHRQDRTTAVKPDSYAPQAREPLHRITAPGALTGTHPVSDVLTHHSPARDRSAHRFPCRGRLFRTRSTVPPSISFEKVDLDAGVAWCGCAGVAWCGCAGVQVRGCAGAWVCGVAREGGGVVGSACVTRRRSRPGRPPRAPPRPAPSFRGAAADGAS